MQGREASPSAFPREAWERGLNIEAWERGKKIKTKRKREYRILNNECRISNEKTASAEGINETPLYLRG
jgi:hypothetical protein